MKIFKIFFTEMAAFLRVALSDKSYKRRRYIKNKRYYSVEKELIIELKTQVLTKT
jgi:hypothetical protein